MPANLNRVMTWNQACEDFENHVLPYTIKAYEQAGQPDWPARREAWNNRWLERRGH